MSRCRSLASSARIISRRYSSSTLRDSLTSRQLPTLYDYLVPTPAHLLETSLVDFQPPSKSEKKLSSSSSSPGQKGTSPQHHRHLPSIKDAKPLLPGGHLIYFPPVCTPSYLLADGTDPSFSPGPPWSNRMWAGGRLQFSSTQEPLRLDGSRAACVERIQDLSLKGATGEEKAFVSVERVVGGVDEGESDDSVRSRLSSTDESKSWSVIETRNLVFMPDAVAHTLTRRERKLLIPTQEASYRRTLQSSGNLLFQFSALTYNAHKIHLDPIYARRQEGHKDLLFHGPLSLTLMCRLLQEAASAEGSRLVELEYRNVAPIYVFEKVDVCCAKSAEKKDSWAVWVENEAGGISVLGRAKFAPLSS